MFDGAIFSVQRGVFDPVRHLSGMVFARWLADQDFSEQRVLEVGTGCGLLAYAVAQSAAQVVATDVDSKAAACAQGNLSDTNIDVRTGDLFEPVVAEHFDLLVVNPPYEIGWSLRPTLRSPNFLFRLALEWENVADMMLLSFPTDSVDVLTSAGFDLRLEHRLATTGRELGVFRGVHGPSPIPRS